VTITGANFTGAATVKFKNKSASFTVNSSTQITATVPSGATTGKISVTTPAGTGTSSSNFTVTGGASMTPLFRRPGGQDEVEVRGLPLCPWPQAGHGLFHVGRAGESFHLSFDGGGAASPEDLREESFEATEPLASLSPASVTAVGRQYFFYTPEMSLMAETELTTNPGAPAVLYEYIWFNGQPVAQIDAGPVTHWTFTDHLGTPLIQTDTAGAIYWRAEHEPYGKVYALRTADQHQPLRLPGQEAEQLNLGPNGGTERSYNIFRWYRNGWGRYTQGDPVGLDDDPNLFAYAVDNPILSIDSLGLKAEVCCRLLTPSFVFFFTGLRHCYIKSSLTTYSLYPEDGTGIPRTRDRKDKGGKCRDCAPKPCDPNQGQCFENAFYSYPVGEYKAWGPNSNTFAATLANACCAGGFPKGLGWTPGTKHSPPVPYR
jgi:RHS repeat-associated protein